MHTCRDVIASGDVVARQGRSFVVISSDKERLTLIPVRPINGSQHRANVCLLDDQDAGLPGLSEADLAIVCRNRVLALRRDVVRVGSVPGAVRRRIVQALRQAVSSSFEQNAALGSALLPETTASGRRVGAARSS